MTEPLDPKVKAARKAVREAVTETLKDFDVDSQEKGRILSLLDDADDAAEVEE